ncbi:MAG: hypothetical protein FWD98_04530 [Defluviitaleaceae bacterium]|nr:hypothetical protein [Defluviitaleaceae bacterium]
MTGRLIATALLAAMLVTLSGCFGQGRVTLATLDTPEAVLVGEIMALQLENFGIDVVRGPVYTSLAQLEAGMLAGEFDLSAVFLQDALTGLPSIGEEPVFDILLQEEIVNNTLRDVFGYMLLEWWHLDARYSMFVREDRDLRLLALSAQAPRLTLAAPQSFFEGAGGFAHMQEMFGGLDFARMYVAEPGYPHGGGQPSHGPGADILVVRGTDNGSWILDAGYAQADGGFSLWPENMLVPLAKEDTIERLPEVRMVLSAISFNVNNDAFARSLRDIHQGVQTAEQAAYDLISQR